MNYAVLPPELNSLRMFTGAGSAPMLAAAVAWDGLAAELGSAASSFGSVTSDLASQAWQGPAAAAMAAAAAPYAGWLSAAAAGPRGGGPGQGGGQRVRGGTGGDGAPFAGGGQPQCVCAVGDVELVRAERAADCGR
ncbi:PPE family protein PPE62 [Mycobacterium tuberculosis]|nr:PPE family protein PPE62 [Mycobacterium tuberculosis]